jgi:hypothetical protein
LPCYFSAEWRKTFALRGSHGMNFLDIPNLELTRSMFPCACDG